MLPGSLTHSGESVRTWKIPLGVISIAAAFGAGLIISMISSDVIVPMFVFASASVDGFPTSL
jgi:hypothetical protein